MAFMYYDFIPGPRPNALEHYAWQMKLEPSSFHHITWWTTLAAAASFNQPSLGNAVVVHVVGGNSLWQMAKKSWFFPLTSCICCTSAKICGWDWKGVIFTGQGQFSHPTTWWIFKSYRGQLAKSIPAFVWNCTTCNVCSCVRKTQRGFRTGRGEERRCVNVDRLVVAKDSRKSLYIHSATAQKITDVRFIVVN